MCVCINGLYGTYGNRGGLSYGTRCTYNIRYNVILRLRVESHTSDDKDKKNKKSYRYKYKYITDADLYCIIYETEYIVIIIIIIYDTYDTANARSFAGKLNILNGRRRGKLPRVNA